MGCVLSICDDDYIDYYAYSDSSDSDGEQDLCNLIPSNTAQPSDFLIVYSIPLGLAAATAPPIST
jgi:hypothetical protein